jgi:hypothetical protein
MLNFPAALRAERREPTAEGGGCLACQWIAFEVKTSKIRAANQKDVTPKAIRQCMWLLTSGLLLYFCSEVFEGDGAGFQ